MPVLSVAGQHPSLLTPDTYQQNATTEDATKGFSGFSQQSFHYNRQTVNPIIVRLFWWPHKHFYSSIQINASEQMLDCFTQLHVIPFYLNISKTRTHFLFNPGKKMCSVKTFSYQVKRSRAFIWLSEITGHTSVHTNKLCPMYQHESLFAYPNQSAWISMTGAGWVLLRSER